VDTSAHAPRLERRGHISARRAVERRGHINARRGVERRDMR
jgi:hypothetical protein